MQSSVGLQEFYKHAKQKTEFVKATVRSFQVGNIEATVAGILIYIT
jgi:hypothetical protein